MRFPLPADVGLGPRAGEEGSGAKTESAVSEAVEVETCHHNQVSR